MDQSRGVKREVATRVKDMMFLTHEAELTQAALKTKLGQSY